MDCLKAGKMIIMYYIYKDLYQKQNKTKQKPNPLWSNAQQKASKYKLFSKRFYQSGNTYEHKNKTFCILHYITKADSQ